MTTWDANISVDPGLLSHLPAVFQGIEREDRLLREFLGAFDEILFEKDGLHTIISSLATYLDPRIAPTAFVPWLASWMGATLFHRLPETKQRRFIANAGEYYRHRGTPGNLKRLLELFTEATVDIEEPVFSTFQIGLQSTIGSEIYIGGGPPHVFCVSLRIPPSEGDDSADSESRTGQVRRLASAVIDLEKPAHTTYELRITPDGVALPSPSSEEEEPPSGAKRAMRSRKRKED